MALTWHGANPPQISAIIDHLIEGVRRPGFTRYKAAREAALTADPQPLGPAQMNQILANLSAATLALGYGYISALVRRDDDTIGEGFWNFISNYLNREHVAPRERENWLELQTRLLHEQADGVVRVLRFVRDEVNRQQ
jgi:hypothetical protein